ncbi:ATP-binding protein [Streptomyces echinatus]|uniref:Anti-sigma regulatory factor (Ser/Thr protein kinase) n=2 Tax=Streptomyces echinatus TaxID=67293 RepID=A0A7W9UW31_9ACTN|nr:anti-sigma regulatory factor (Ser/Thr protein kinase) [Streptomyces echinatus]
MKVTPMKRALSGEDNVAFMAFHPMDGPLHASAAFEGQGSCIAEARDMAVGFLTRMRTEHGVAVSQRALELTRLVVSELVTNACKYAAGPILLDVRIAGELVEIQVWDCDPVLPMARAAEAGRVGQHGLEIVMAVCQGFEAMREPVGKRIIARLALKDDPLGHVTKRPVGHQATA